MEPRRERTTDRKPSDNKGSATEAVPIEPTLGFNHFGASMTVVGASLTRHQGNTRVESYSCRQASEKGLYPQGNSEQGMEFEKRASVGMPTLFHKKKSSVKHGRRAS